MEECCPTVLEHDLFVELEPSPAFLGGLVNLPTLTIVQIALR